MTLCIVEAANGPPLPMKLFPGVRHPTQLFLDYVRLLTDPEYSFTVPHDMQTLVSFMGGNETFESRLDTMVRIHWRNSVASRGLTCNQFQPGVAKQNLGANGAGITTLMNIG
jgi:hypothetical protein